MEFRRVLFRSRLSVSIHPPGRHIEQPPPPLRRCRGHLPLQGLSQGRRRTAAGHDPRRRRVHPPLPPPRPASRIPPHPPLSPPPHPPPHGSSPTPATPPPSSASPLPSTPPPSLPPPHPP